MKYVVLIFGLIAVAVLGVYLYQNVGGALPAVLPPREDIVEIIEGQNETDFPLSIPDNWKLSIYASGLSKPRVIEFDPNGVAVVSDTGTNEVYALTPEKQVIADGLNRPHGIVFYGSHIYIAETDKIVRYDYEPENLSISNPVEIASLPADSIHFTRSLLVNGDKLLVSVGSSCNVCNETDPRRAKVMSVPLEGGELVDFSTGLRNAVFMAEHPESGEVWVTEMGRDRLGDDIPPDEINILQNGGFYGWPYCYGASTHDNTFDRSESAIATCKRAMPSHIDLQAHSAPLGLAFLSPTELLVAYHGSWNRTVPTGYKIVKFTLNESGSETLREDFLTGWLQGSQSLGRPVDVKVYEGNIYISDDKAGVIYILERI